MRWALRLEKMMHEAHALSLTHDLDRGNATSLGVASGGRGNTPMPLVTSVISVSSSSLMACTFIMVGVGVAAAASRARCRLWSSGAREKEETRKRRGRDEREKPEVVSGEKTNDREVCRDVGRRRSRSYGAT